MENKRCTGRTTRMLQGVIEMLPNASQLPILVYGKDIYHSEALAKMFMNLAQKNNIRVMWMNGHKVVCNRDEIVEFRSFSDEDSPLGTEYSHIFIDHYAEEYYGM